VNKLNFSEDELDDVKPQQKSTTQAAAAAAPAEDPVAALERQLAAAKAAAAHKPAAAATPAPKAAQPAAVEDELDEKPVASGKSGKNAVVEEEDNMDVDFGDDKLATRPNQLPRCRPSEKGKAVRFALLPFMKPKSAKNHFVEMPGKKLTARCLTPQDADQAGYCCAKLGEDGELHVAALVIRYLNADSKNGALDKNVAIDWEIQYVDLTRSNYRQVSHLVDELIEDNPNISVYDIDIVMHHDPDRAFGYQFKRISQKARWKMNPELVNEVKAAAEKFTKDDGKILKARLGKKMTLAEWKALLTTGAAGAEEAKLDDVVDL